MIVVTGATGKLGRLVIQQLLEKLPASEVVAAVRTPKKAADLAALGVHVRQADYAKPETLSAAFAGAEKVLLISSSEVGQRTAQHKAVVDAAKAAGVTLLAYTSVLRADTSALGLAREHQATEEYIRSAGLPFVFLRNSWYMENHTAALGTALERGVILGAAGNGRFAAATRADFAGAAVAALTSKGHRNKIYELGGDTPYTLTELADEVTKQSGKQVRYQNMPENEYQSALIGSGLPAPIAAIIADSDAGAAKGDLDDSSHHLSTLLGRPTVSLAEAIRAVLP